MKAVDLPIAGHDQGRLVTVESDAASSGGRGRWKQYSTRYRDDLPLAKSRGAKRRH